MAYRDRDLHNAGSYPSHFLHGTRILNEEPLIDQAIFQVPPAYTASLTDRALTLSVLDYNRIQNETFRLLALGRLATRTLNSFFILDPRRHMRVTTTDMIELWSDYGVDSATQVNAALRGIDTLDAIRQVIDGKPFVGTEKGAGANSRQQWLSISPDIAINDTRRTDS